MHMGKQKHPSKTVVYSKTQSPAYTLKQVCSLLYLVTYLQLILTGPQ